MRQSGRIVFLAVALGGVAGAVAAAEDSQPRALPRALPAVGAHAPWQLAERNEDPAAGWVVYKRRLADSDSEVFRLEAVIDAPPARVAEAFRRNVVDPAVSQRHTSKTVLRDEGDIVVVHSYIDMPLVSDRDVISRCERVAASGAGSYRFQWWATDQGPAPAPGVVRIEKSDGYWEFRPMDDPEAGPGGRTLATYESHTEIGGMVPAWLVNQLMLDTVVDGLDHLRARVQQDTGVGPLGRRSSDSKSR